MRTIPCLYEKDEINGDGSCGYGATFNCEECICNGGKLDPESPELIKRDPTHD